MRTHLYTLLVITLTIFSGKLFAAMPTTAEPILSIPTLPLQFQETRYQNIQQDLDQRITLFLKGRPHQDWTPNKPREEILKEFDLINDWRYHIWYVDPSAKTLISRVDFKVAQDLLEKGLYRKPNVIAFDFNNASHYYNASTLLVNGYKILAMDAPTNDTLQSFFILLQNQRVTQLVRLSGNGENGTEKSNPYWVSKLKTDAKSKESMISITQANSSVTYPIRYYSTDTWAENQMLPTKELLKLIQKVQKGYDANKGIIACHSSSGSGRTGTFLAGFLLINEIDKQIAAGTPKSSLDISIERMCMQLSLQRPYLIKKPEQYIALYRLVDLYMSTLK